MEKLKERWGISSNWQIVAILVVFAINGSFAAWVAGPITSFFGLDSETTKPYVSVYFFKNFVNFSNLSDYPSISRMALWTIQIFLGF